MMRCGWLMTRFMKIAARLEHEGFTDTKVYDKSG